MEDRLILFGRHRAEAHLTAQILRAVHDRTPGAKGRPVPVPRILEAFLMPMAKAAGRDPQFVRVMGRTMLEAWPAALVVIADDHLNVFSFDAVPAFCVRIGQSVEKMVQDGAIEFDRALDAFARWDTRRLNELGGSLHLLVSIPELGAH